MITKLNWEYKSQYNYFLADTIPSTNTYFKENYQDYPDKSILIALEQTAGRGRYDRKWRSEKDIMFSLLLKKNAEYAIITPLAVCMGLEKLGYKPGIKWPNDIYLENKKLCGILIEDIYEGGFEAAIIGIGINMTDKDAVDGIGLKGNAERFQVIQKIMEAFNTCLTLSFDELVEAYKSRSIILGREVYYQNQIYKAVDIDADGHLILQNDGSVITVSCDEINIKESLR